MATAARQRRVGGAAGHDGAAPEKGDSPVASYDGGIGLWPDGFAGISASGVFAALPDW